MHRPGNMGHRILVVDDYAEAAEIACMLFDLLGHECHCAHSGREALAQTAALKPDVVILDIGLPDLSGYEVARELRANYPELYLVAMTGLGDREDVVRAYAAGFDEHLVKPTDESKLQKMLQHADQRSQAQHPQL